MISLLKQTEPREERLLSAALLSHELSYEDTDRANPATMGSEFYPEDLPVQSPPDQERILRNKHSLLSFASGTMSTTSTSAVPIAATNFVFEKTAPRSIQSTRSLEALVNKFAGRILYYISASNWSVVFGRLRSTIHQMSQHEEVDTDDLTLLKHCAMDKRRLIQVLHG